MLVLANGTHTFMKHVSLLSHVPGGRLQVESGYVMAVDDVGVQALNRQRPPLHVLGSPQSLSVLHGKSQTFAPTHWGGAAHVGEHFAGP